MNFNHSGTLLRDWQKRIEDKLVVAYFATVKNLVSDDLVCKMKNDNDQIEIKDELEARYLLLDNGEDGTLQHNGTNNSTCDACQKPLSSKYGSTVHTESRSSKCDSCTGTLKPRSRKSAKKKRKCVICGKEIWNLNLHLLTHSRVKEFRCGICGEDFNTKDSYKRHQAAHRALGEIPAEDSAQKGKEKAPKVSGIIEKVKCGVCEKSIKKSSLSGHMISHDDTRKFSCEHCGATFKRRGELTGHLARHTGFRRFQCGLCEKTYTRKAHLVGHLASHEGLKKRFPCDQCPKQFALERSLRRHKKEAHEGLRPFQCEVCPKSFTQKVGLQSHATTHTKMKLFECHLCDKSFSRVGYLSQHVKTHAEKDVKRKRTTRTPAVKTINGKKVFACAECPSVFSSQANLHRHKMATHEGLKRFECAICLRRFAQKVGLREHMPTHTRVKGFKCRLCGKAYAQRRSLALHDFKKHTGLKRFECGVCQAAFARKAELKLHLTSHAAEEGQGGGA